MCLVKCLHGSGTATCWTVQWPRESRLTHVRSRPSCSVGTVSAVDTFSGFRLALRCRFKADLQACIGDTSLPPDKRFLCLSERGTLDWPWLREQQIASLQQFLQPSPGLDYARSLTISTRGLPHTHGPSPTQRLLRAVICAAVWRNLQQQQLRIRSLASLCSRCQIQHMP